MPEVIPPPTFEALWFDLCEKGLAPTIELVEEKDFVIRSSND